MPQIAERLEPTPRIGDPVELAISRLDARSLAETVRGQWIVEPTFRPSPSERRFMTPFLIVHVERQGCAYCLPADLDELRSTDLVGVTVETCLGMPQHVRVAVVDAVYGPITDGEPSDVITLDGTVTAKARARGALVREEAEGLVSSNSAPRVALIGYSGEIASQLSEGGYDVDGYDLDPAVVSHPAKGLRGAISHGNQFYGQPQYDLVVATGMTLVTRTFERIARHCIATGARLLMYCQSGANLGGALLECGATTVVAEPLPFYNWEGVSRVLIYRS
jgi:putative heavy-metal chelation protein